MGLLDWTIYNDGGGIGGGNSQAVIYTDIINPISGSGSVALTHLPSDEFQSINLVPSTYPTGFENGKIRTLIRFDDMDDISSQENHAGMLAMQNVENLSEFGTTNTAYGLSVSVGEGFSPQSFRLWKFVEGLDGGSGSLNTGQALDSVALPFTLTTNSVVCMEFEWQASGQIVSELGGVLLIGRLGQSTTFDDLTTLITVVDTTSPFTTTVAESIFAGFKNQAASGTNRVTFDQTSLIELIIS
jgi:hypothetical protein